MTCSANTVTAYVESATGIEVSGRTSFTAIITNYVFIINITCTTVTSSALIIVGVLMMVQLKDVNWDKITLVAHVFFTILMMLLTYSISTGIAWGFVIYTIANFAVRNTDDINWITWIMVIIFALFLFIGL